MADAAQLDEVVRAWLRCAAQAVHERRASLTELDAAIGDGDHGINLDRGFMALLADLDAGVPAPGDPASTLTAAGRRLMGIVGGASGALYGRGLMVAGERVRAMLAGSGGVAAGADMAGAILAGLVDGVTGLGHAGPGDKTMLDALMPAAGALGALDPALPGTRLEAAARAAADGAEGTTPLVARKGRASYLGERSAGHRDPGAASSALLVGCLVDACLADVAAR